MVTLGKILLIIFVTAIILAFEVFMWFGLMEAPNPAILSVNGQEACEGLLHARIIGGIICFAVISFFCL